MSVSEELRQRAVQAGLIHWPAWGYGYNTTDGRRVGRGSRDRWFWEPPGTKTTADRIEGLTEEEALTAYLDAHHPLPPPSTQEQILATEDPAAMAVALDHWRDTGEGSAALEAAISQWMHANPDTFLRLVGEAKIADGWHQRERRRLFSKEAIGEVVKERDSQAIQGAAGWRYWALGMPTFAGQPSADAWRPTEQEAMAAVDAALLAEGYALVGGAVLPASPAAPVEPPVQEQPAAAVVEEVRTALVEARRTLFRMALERVLVRGMRPSTGNLLTEMGQPNRTSGRLTEEEHLWRAEMLEERGWRYTLEGGWDPPAPDTRCPTCNGQGDVVTPFSRYGAPSRCPDCAGTGRARGEDSAETVEAT